MRNQFQDIIPPNRRSIRNIPLPNEKSSGKEKKEGKKNTGHGEAEADAGENTASLEVEFAEKEILTYGGRPRVGGFSKFVLWLITLGCVGGLFFAVTWLFTGANVTVKQKKMDVAFSGQQEFSVDPAFGEVGYSAITLSESLSVLVQATGEKEVSEKASGTIMVYNDFGTSAQKLVSGTRFETPKGLIYKLDSAISVPGRHIEAGKNIPGSIEAKVTAEKAGPVYNVDLTDFTIPGFEGGVKFDKFYARSKTIMAGGVIGKIATLDDAVLAAETDKLKADLRSKLAEKIKKQMPPSQTLIEGLEEASFSVASPKSENGKAKIEVTGNVKYFTADTQSLARSLLTAQNIPLDNKETFDVDSS